MKDIKLEKEVAFLNRIWVRVASNVFPNIIIVTTYEPTRNGNGSAEIIGTINSSSHQVNSIWKLTVKRKILFNAKIKQNTMRN